MKNLFNIDPVEIDVSKLAVTETRERNAWGFEQRTITEHSGPGKTAVGLANNLYVGQKNFSEPKPAAHWVHARRIQTALAKKA